VAELYAYATGGRTVSIDDAYVDTDKVGVSTDIAGTVAFLSGRLASPACGSFSAARPKKRLRRSWTGWALAP